MCVGGQYPYEIPVNVRFQGGWALPEFLWKMLIFLFLGGGTSGSPNPCSANTFMAPKGSSINHMTGGIGWV